MLTTWVTVWATQKLEGRNKGVKILNLVVIQHWSPTMFWKSTAGFVPIAAREIPPHDSLNWTSLALWI